MPVIRSVVWNKTNYQTGPNNNPGLLCLLSSFSSSSHTLIECKLRNTAETTPRVHIFASSTGSRNLTCSITMWSLSSSKSVADWLPEDFYSSFFNIIKPKSINITDSLQKHTLVLEKSSHPYNRPWWSVRFLGAKDPNVFQATGSQIVMRRPAAIYAPVKFLVLVSVKYWINPRAIRWVDGVGKLGGGD
jgi:hypothetical protein